MKTSLNNRDFDPIKKLTEKKRYEKLTLLKKSHTVPPASPVEARLETFDNVYTDRNYEITFECPEFTSLCPVTSQPDFGEIQIRYTPDKLCVESKSLKIFLFSFRNFHAFHEEIINTILDAIVHVARPRHAEVTGKFRPRGGISLIIRAEFKN